MESKPEEICKAETKETGTEQAEDKGNIKYCPYNNIKGLFSGLFGGSRTAQNSTQQTLETEDTEKAINIDDEPKGKCPFGFDKPKASVKKTEKPKGKCPFGYSNDDDEEINTTTPKKEGNSKINDNDDDVDSDDNQPTSGCPVMNKGKRDPVNKIFEPFYEIPCYGQYDFLFLMRGSWEPEEWLQKTEKLRKYPRYLKGTLFFQAQEKLQKVHEVEFPKVFFIYDDIKQKANRLFRRKKYKEAIEHMTYAYGLLKWIQFKDKKRQADFVVKPSLEAILDEDLEEKSCYLDDVKVEEDSYKACIVFLLEIMAYAHMELRQYHCALECLDECAEIAEDKLPDVYFRRSQARACNKFSTEEELELAMQDIDKAIKLKDTEEIYKEHKAKLEGIIQERAEKKLEKIRKLLEKAKRSRDHIKERQLNIEDCIFTSNEDCDRQYKIWKEMKSKYYLAIKFFTETKNEEQLGLTYKEFETFHQSFENFQFFYKFRLTDIDPKSKNNLTQEEREILEDKDAEKLIDQYKFKICENWFGDGGYNIELFQYALEKVFEDERKVEEERQKEEEWRNPKQTWTEYLCNITKSNYTIYGSVVFIVISIAAIAAHFYMYNNGSFGKTFK